MTTGRRAFLPFLFLSILIGACRTASSHTDVKTAAEQNDLTNAVAWIQTSAEADALRRQAFRSATVALDKALDDPTWTATDEQTGDFSELPPAVIVDVDETVLDNSPLEARLIRRRQQFNPELWKAWVEERRAEPIPGALEFAQHAAGKGVTVFYVTNRDADEEAATRDNLTRVGFPVDDRYDVVLTRGENGAPSDKTSRRQIVASTHRILLLLGDDLGDFTSRDGSVEDRLERVLGNEQRWGVRWFVFPNPMYGSWESALRVGMPEGSDAKVDALDEAVD
jgi:acid phosphatase